MLLPRFEETIDAMTLVCVNLEGQIPRCFPVTKPSWLKLDSLLNEISKASEEMNGIKLKGFYISYR